MQAGQRLARFVNKERREFDLEKKRAHIEQFGPILIEGIGRITNAPRPRLDKAKDGLMKILGRDEAAAEDALAHASAKQKEMVKKLDQYDEEDFDKQEDDEDAEA
jgi:DNA topoisomerase-6 subunit B